jgi:thiol-disulfide isomerase/thioredoxin
MGSNDLVQRLQAVFRQKYQDLDSYGVLSPSSQCSACSAMTGYEKNMWGDCSACLKLGLFLGIIYMIYLLIQRSGMIKCTYGEMNILDDNVVATGTTGLQHITGKEYMNSAKACLFVHASWCGHCKDAMPTITDMATQGSGVDFFALEEPNQGPELNISAFPVFILFSMGKEVDRIVGADIPKLKQSLASLSAQ